MDFYLNFDYSDFQIYHKKIKFGRHVHEMQHFVVFASNYLGLVYIFKIPAVMIGILLQGFNCPE